MDAPSASPPKWPYVALSLWLLAAAAVGASGVLARLRPPAPQLVLVGLTLLLVVAWFASAGFRAWAGSLDLRAVVAFHLTRFVGAWFLVLYGRGELPYAFAIPAGWGDLAVALGALVLAGATPRLGRRGYRRALLAWNVLGLVDILAVVATAARLAIADPDSMSALLRMPLNLLLTFVVPVIIATHLLVFARLRRRPAASPHAAHGAHASHQPHGARAARPRGGRG